MSEIKCVTYNPNYDHLLDQYFKQTGGEIRNNHSKKALRLNEYDGKNAELFLVIQNDTTIIGMSSIFTEHLTPQTRCARLYSRLHITPTFSQWLIDKYLEPALHQWIISQDIQHCYLTVNEGHERTLQWVCARLGKKRAKKLPNSYGYTIGQQTRQSWKPHSKLIYERHTWQYCLFSSPNDEFFLKRDEKSIDPKFEYILTKHF